MLDALSPGLYILFLDLTEKTRKRTKDHENVRYNLVIHSDEFGRKKPARINEEVVI